MEWTVHQKNPYSVPTLDIYLKVGTLADKTSVSQKPQLHIHTPVPSAKSDAIQENVGGHS